MRPTGVLLKSWGSERAHLDMAAGFEEATFEEAAKFCQDVKLKLPGLVFNSTTAKWKLLEVSLG